MSCRTCYTADLATFRIMFPAFVGVDDATVQFYLDGAQCELDENEWGCTLPLATLYYAAHNLARSQNIAASSQSDLNGNIVTNPTAGRLTSATADGLSVSYSGPLQSQSGNAFDSSLSTTPYGVDFLALKYRQMPLGTLALTNTCGSDGYFYG